MLLQFLPEMLNETRVVTMTDSEELLTPEQHLKAPIFLREAKWGSTHRSLIVFLKPIILLFYSLSSIPLSWERQKEKDRQNFQHLSWIWWQSEQVKAVWLCKSHPLSGAEATTGKQGEMENTKCCSTLLRSKHISTTSRKLGTINSPHAPSHIGFSMKHLIPSL